MREMIEALLSDARRALEQRTAEGHALNETILRLQGSVATLTEVLEHLPPEDGET